jgi:hypothetical protein
MCVFKRTCGESIYPVLECLKSETVKGNWWIMQVTEGFYLLTTDCRPLVRWSDDATVHVVARMETEL